MLPPVVIGDTGIVENTGVDAETFEVKPASGEKINALAIDESLTLTAGQSKVLSCTVDGEVTLT